MIFVPNGDRRFSRGRLERRLDVTVVAAVRTVPH
jgi:hypothetical protein